MKSANRAVDASRRLQFVPRCYALSTASAAPLASAHIAARSTPSQRDPRKLLPMSGLLTSVISAAAAFLIAVAGYVFTKQKEREAEWRKEKLAYYKEFVDSLSGTIAGETSAQGQVRFARACNNILLFAPYAVITALDRFHEETRVSNPAKSLERHDQLLSQLFLEIRKDIGVIPNDHPASFHVHLWSSGVSTSSAGTGG